MMKNLYSFGLSVVILFVMLPVAMADTTADKQKNDQNTSITKPIAQYDINPFSDQQRVLRNDRSNQRFSNNERLCMENKDRVREND